MKSVECQWRLNRFRLLFMLVAVTNALAGCAVDPRGQDDPYEKTNRAIFAFDQNIDAAVARPVAVFYNHAVPAVAREGIHNALSNLHAPVTFGNAALQGKSRLAGQTVLRFVINSSAGLGGLVDVAAKNGIPRGNEDFGVTLGVWGWAAVPILSSHCWARATLETLPATSSTFLWTPLHT